MKKKKLFKLKPNRKTPELKEVSIEEFKDKYYKTIAWIASQDERETDLMINSTKKFIKQSVKGR